MIQWTFLRSAGVGGKSCCRAGCGSLHIQLPIFGLSHSLKAVLLRPPPPRMTWSHLCFLLGTFRFFPEPWVGVRRLSVRGFFGNGHVFLGVSTKKQTAENGELDYVNIRILANV